MICVAIMLLLAFGWARAEMTRPMDEMHGDCSHFAVNLKREFRLWAESSSTIVSADTEMLPVSKKISLLLRDQATLHFAADPAKVFPTERPHGGIFEFDAKSSGQYRVSVGSKIWFDVVDAGSKEIVMATSFEMQTQCKAIFKTVAYDLRAGHKYYIQVSSSPYDRVDMLVTR